MLKITIYTTRTCPFCKMEKEYMDSKSIQYEEILVDERPEEAQKMITMSGQLGVPFTVIKKEDGQEEKILGFDKTKIDQILQISS